MTTNDGSDTVKVCPECGKPLAEFDVYAHALAHWPEYQDPAKTSPEARKRQTQLLNGGVNYDEYLKAHDQGV